MQAMLTADHQLQRTQQLVEIGAASRQDLEDVTAGHASHATEVEAAASGFCSWAQPRARRGPEKPLARGLRRRRAAPIAGVITSRAANLGQVVSMGQELFVVTDLSQVWVIGDLYEQDFQSVHVGSEAAHDAGLSALTLRGRVATLTHGSIPSRARPRSAWRCPTRRGGCGWACT